MSNEELVLCIQRGEDVVENLEILYMNNLPLIRKIAARFTAKAELEDLTQEAYFGLIRAVELWDPEKDVLFMSYAAYWIKQQMLRYIHDQSTTIRIPSYQRGVMRAYYQIKNSYRVRFGRNPEEVEICHALDLSREQYQQLLKDLRTVKTCSTSAPVGEDGETTLEDLIPAEGDPIGDVVDRVSKEEEKRALWSEVDRLPEREAEVIKSRYRDNLTLKQCGEALGVSSEMVRQLQEKALRKLRRPSVQRRLSPYLTDSAAYSLGLRGTGRQSFERHGSAQERAVMQLERLSGMSLWGGRLIEEIDAIKKQILAQ